MKLKSKVGGYFRLLEILWEILRTFLSLDKRYINIWKILIALFGTPIQGGKNEQIAIELYMSGCSWARRHILKSYVLLQLCSLGNIW